ncbi:replication initiator protein [Capybara microvirus Cap3_SP_450]|nr:replication initiator protein [Capybara microvirus Cap3_SP_450]
MTCYNPKIRIEFENEKLTKTGKITKQARIISSNSPEFMGYEYYDKNFPLQDGTKAIRIPCGVCIGCRSAQQLEWAVRLEKEESYWDNNYFLTLTYDEEHLPLPGKIELDGEIYKNNGNWKGCLIKKDLQDFWKRLREYYRDKEGYIGIRHYSVGEYGGTGKRPHYHAIAFNMPEIEDLELFSINKLSGNKIYTSKTIEKIWGKGYITIGEVSWDSIAYVAGYCTKKLFGKKGKEIYAKKGQIPEFSLCSRKPGIAKQWYIDHMYDIYSTDEMITAKGRKVKPPAYYDKLFDLEYPEQLELIKSERRSRAKQAAKNKAAKTTLDIKSQLRLEEETHKKREEIKRRNNTELPITKSVYH